MGYLPRVSHAARSRLLRLVLCLLGFGVALGARDPAQAQPALLSFRAPQDCASKAAIELKIQQLLGDEPSAPAEPVRARVQIDKAHGRYQLRLLLEIGTHHAERRLHAASCSELGDTAAWLIALAVNPELSTVGSEQQARADAAKGEHEGPRSLARGAAQGQASDASNTRTAQASAADGKTQAAAASQARPPKAGEQDAANARAAEDEGAEPSRRRLTIVSKGSARDDSRALRAGANAGVFTGGPSDVQAALGAFVGISVGWSHTQARFSGLLPRHVDIAQGASANIWSLMLDLTQCALWGQQIRAGPCLALSGLRTAAEVRGLARPTHQAALWANTAAGLQVFWRVGAKVELSLSLAAGIPISPRPRFTVQGVGPIIAAKPWSSDARLGVSFVSK